MCQDVVNANIYALIRHCSLSFNTANMEFLCIFLTVIACLTVRIESKAVFAHFMVRVHILSSHDSVLN